MRVLIIEDERSASDFLVKLIGDYDSTINIIDTLRSVESSVIWFKQNLHPDIAFVDIQLADGLSFEIFDKVQVHCPVVFTTAFQQYAIEAFRVNSIEYLLKPIDPIHLARAFEKYRLYGQPNPIVVNNDFTSRVLKAMDMLTPTGKTRFIVRVGVHLRPVQAIDIICFYSLEKATFLIERQGKTYDIDLSLDGLQDQVDGGQFFRINRKFLLNRDYITDVIAYSGSRYKIKLKGFDDNDLLVSRKRAAEFKRWLEEG